MAGKTKTADTVITAYKGFNADWTCRNSQYEVGKTYNHSGDVSICHSGFHAYESPFDVWGYYDITGSKFAIVEMRGAVSRENGSDTKLASAEITIKAELSLPEFIKRAVDFVIEATRGKTDSASGDYAQIGASGNNAKIGASGYNAKIGASGYNAKIGASGNNTQIGASGNNTKIGASGDYAKIGASGYNAQIGASGDYAQIGASGYNAQIGASGNYAKIGASGNNTKIGASGDYAKIGASGYNTKIGASGNNAKIGASGDYAKIEVTGENAVVASAGYDTRVKGRVGSWVSLAEFNSDGKCIGFATGQIEKPETWYRAEGGKLVEAA